ncbi:hypothetical protein ACJX0J_021995, partial [Zea mays]
PISEFACDNKEISEGIFSFLYIILCTYLNFRETSIGNLCCNIVRTFPIERRLLQIV